MDADDMIIASEWLLENAPGGVLQYVDYLVGELEAENARLTDQLQAVSDQLAEARADLAWINYAADWLQNNLADPRAWQCAQDIADRSKAAD